MESNVRLLSKKELKTYVLYSSQHIARMEKAGEFPKRVRLGPYRSSRVGWLESEVRAWLQVRLERRSGTTDAAP